MVAPGSHLGSEAHDALKHKCDEDAKGRGLPAQPTKTERDNTPEDHIAEPELSGQRERDDEQRCARRDSGDDRAPQRTRIALYGGCQSEAHNAGDPQPSS
ncbi:hypothetical protein KRMM14A1259_19250 [Krasilnikovia sp. MM14-A1259]